MLSPAYSRCVRNEKFDELLDTSNSTRLYTGHRELIRGDYVMRRSTWIALILFSLGVLGCTSFIKQPQSEFFSTQKGPNTSAFDTDTSAAKTADASKK